MSLAKYDTYKDSGIDYLGNIPEQWEVKRLKDLGSLQNGISQGKDYFGFGFPFVSYGNVYNNTIEPRFVDGLANSSKKEQQHYSVLEGDVFFTRTSETVDEIGISATALQTIHKATFSGFVIRLRPKKSKITKEYSNFFFKAHTNRLFLSKEISLVTRASLSQNKLNNLPVLLPNKTQQTAIATYLDRKTSAINQKIALLELKTIHYQQLRKSLINETVCRGLDKTVKLKDSGIEWIRKIPEHWEAKRLKDKYNLFTGNSISDKSLFENKINSLDYVSTKDIDIETGQIMYDNGVYIPKNVKSFKIAKANSILLCLEGGSAGKKVGFNTKDICFVNKLCSMKGKTKNVNEKYQFYCIQSPVFERQFFAILNGLIGGVSLNSIKFFNILYPPDQEQAAIAAYLDEKTQQIDSITTSIKSQIETLKELRKTLINNVVTGKINIIDKS